jgi:hypothetical protein
MKRVRTWYECDYCGKDLSEAKLVNSDGYGGIWDESLCNHTVDICDNPECYQKHLELVRNRMRNSNGLLYYPLDILVDKEGTEYKLCKDNKVKVKWNKEDNLHTYSMETLIKKLIPVYEKYCISGNGK